MYSGSIFVPARRNDPSPKKLNVDAIMVSVDHHKGRGITASLYMADGRMVNITNGHSVVLEPASRLNRKKVEMWREIARNQIDAQGGQVWYAIQSFCYQHGLALDTPVNA